jgi:hypothetical protein
MSLGQLNPSMNWADGIAHLLKCLLQIERDVHMWRESKSTEDLPRAKVPSSAIVMYTTLSGGLSF